VFILTGFVLPGCNNSPPSSVSIDLEAMYADRDTSRLAEAIDQHHFLLRRELDILLKGLLESKASQDSLTQSSLTPRLAWLCDSYRDLSGLTDKVRLLQRRLTWSAEESANRLTLDTAYRELDSRRRSKSVPGVELREQLLQLRYAYAVLCDSFTVTSIDHALGQSWAEEGTPDSATVFLSRSLQLSILLDNLQQAGFCELLAARIHTLNSADYLASEKALLRAADHFKRVGDFHYEAGIRTSRAYNSSLIYQTSEAIEGFRAARLAYAHLGDPRSEAYCTYALGMTFFFGNQLDSAAHYTELALQKRRELAEAHPESTDLLEDVAYAEDGVAFMFQHQGELTGAHERYTLAEKLFLKCDGKEGLCTNRLNHASLLRLEEKYDQAREKYRFVLENSAEFEISIHAQFGLAACDYYQGYADAALANLRRCIQRLEISRNQLAMPNLTAGMLTDKLTFYQLAVCILLERYQDDHNPIWLDSAFNYLEMSKAKSLVDLLQASGSPVDTKGQDHLVARISMVENDLLLGRGDSLTHMSALSVLQDSLRAARIRANPGQLVSDKAADRGRPDLVATRSMLNDSNTVILSYMVSEFGSYLFAITQVSVQVYPIPLEPEGLTLAVNQYVEAVSHPPDGSIEDDNWKENARKLCDALIPHDILNDKTIKRFIIIPAGRLHYLPFEALVDSHDRYLVELYDVSYAPSVTTLEILQEPGLSTSDDQVVAFGDPQFADPGFVPLKYSRDEVQVLTDLFGTDRVQSRLGDQATEIAFRNTDFDNVRYVHLATHGMCNERRPDRSALLMAEDTSEPGTGLLHPDEIAALEIPVELVFLSACRSGSGLSYPGEGVLSLAQPFFVAGASSVVASYWNINDRVAVDIVDSFYSGLGDGKTKAAALAEAKRALISSERKLYHHPYFWAPFVLIGEYD